MNIESIDAYNLKLKKPTRNQYEFQRFCLDDLIPENHKVHLIWNFVAEMDLSVCLNGIHSFKGAAGRPSVDPRIMLTLWIYSIIDGNASARKLEELCQHHNVYKWICGGVLVNRTSLAEFRSTNPRKFDELLVSCLAVMVKSGLVSDSDFSQDGTRVKANAGMNSFRREDTLKQIEVKLTEHIELLRTEEKGNLNMYEKRKLANKERLAEEKKSRVRAALDTLYASRFQKIANTKRNHDTVSKDDLENIRSSITDPQVRKMKMGDGGYRLAYNVQFATGLDSRVIYGVDVVSALDPGTPPRLMAQVQEVLKRLKLDKIKNWIADAAYSSKNDIITAAQLFSDCFYFAPPKPNKNVDPKIVKKDECEAVKNWRESIGSEHTCKLYRKRCSTAEFSNMQVKNHALREFLVRGLVKVRGSAFLHALAVNIQRAMDLMKNKINSIKF